MAVRLLATHPEQVGTRSDIRLVRHSSVDISPDDPQGKAELSPAPRIEAEHATASIKYVESEFCYIS